MSMQKMKHFFLVTILLGSSALFVQAQKAKPYDVP